MADLPPIKPTPKVADAAHTIRTTVVRADQPVEVETEEEIRQREAQEYLDSIPESQRQRMTEEEIQAERDATLAGVPMANGKPIPEPSGLTQEQMRNNPSNYQPAIEDTIAANTFTGVSSEIMAPTVTRGEPVIVNAASFDKLPATEEDNRQWWVCIQSDGIRTMDNKGQVHAAFQSDVHLMDVMVRCPVCESVSVRKVQPGEDLGVSENAAKWMRERTVKMGLNPILRG
jgi:hypothetical protein